MIDKYSYGNGKINYVNDKTKDLEQKEYQDNIHEIIVLEDMIEELDELLVKIDDSKLDLEEDNVNLQKKINNFTKRKINWIIGLLLILVVAIGMDIGILKLFCSTSLYANIFVFGFTGILYVYTFFNNFVPIIFDRKKDLIQELTENINRYNGLQQEELSLKEILDNLKERLNRLYNDKKREKESSMTSEIVEVNYRERLKQQKTYLELMYQCGYYKNEYLKLYQNGQLQDKLNQTYNQKKASIIYDYIEEQYNRELVPKKD